MPSALYKFTRERTAGMRTNRPSTDAIGALHQWESRGGGRRYSVDEDEDEHLIARLEWSASDGSAGDDLNAATAHFRVERSYLECGTVMNMAQRTGMVVLRCEDGSFAAAKLMHSPNPQVGDVHRLEVA
jgi:hypothetical protein